MRERRKKSWACRGLRAKGLTLVEALAGTAVLGVLLGGMVLAAARLEALSRRAALAEEACDVADELMEKFWQDLRDFPRNTCGESPTRKGWTWRTSVRRDEAALLGEVRAEVVALEVFAPGRPDQPAGRVEALAPVLPKTERAPER